MNKLLLLAMASVASTCFAAAPTMKLNYDPDSYKALTSKADNDYKAAKDKCGSESGNAKDVCLQQAKADHARAQADAVAQYKNDRKDVEKSKVAVANADYDLAKAKCDDLKGSAKTSCVDEAKSAKKTAVADAKNDLRTAQGGQDCSQLSGSEKASCITHSKTSAAGEAVADTVITTKVKTDLIKEPDLKSMDVHVDTVNGVVVLSGFVPSQAQVDKAVQVARGVQGVTEVQNNLKIKQ